MKMPRIWEILSKFKTFCRLHGWKTSDSGDWIEIANDYHNFLWARNIHPSSFKRIVADGKCVVKEGLSYHVVNASYTAWLFSETPPADVVKTVLERREFSNKVALYDLSPLFEGESFCVKLNNTDSPVFQEFENFLQTELSVRLRPLSLGPEQNGQATGSAIAEFA